MAQRARQKRRSLRTRQLPIIGYWQQVALMEIRPDPNWFERGKFFRLSLRNEARSLLE
jgi:hypothetical protein